ncbi:MAG: glycosyltransferase [Balneolaceae bacterium]
MIQKNKIKIGLLVGTLNSGGAERMMVNLANSLHEQGMAVKLILVNKTGPYLAEVHSAIEIVDLKAKSGVKSVFFKLRKLLYGNSLDVLISTQPHINSVVGFCTIGLKHKPLLIFREANTPDSKYSETGYISNQLFKIGFKFSDHYVAVSNGVKDAISNYYNIDEQHITTIYNPVVDATLEQKSKEMPDHPWLAQNEIPVIIAMGRVVPQKDHKLLMNAFARVLKVQKAKLLVLGDKDQNPEYAAELVALVKTLGIKDSVELIGFKPNPFSYLSKASLFVLSSIYEGLPGSLVQALACGCPVVSTNCPSGPAEILENGKYGKLVPVGNVDALTKAILESLEEEHDKDKLKSRASDFSAEKAGEKYLRLIDKLLSK